jgi:hypothetical protein
MSALGQKRTWALQSAMSALPPIATAKADSVQGHVYSTRAAAKDVRFGPIADIVGPIGNEKNSVSRSQTEHAESAACRQKGKDGQYHRHARVGQAQCELAIRPFQIVCAVRYFRSVAAIGLVLLQRFLNRGTRDVAV